MDLTKEEIQEIIDYEVIVDCYDEYEMNTGWAIYMDENINYPFEALYEVKYSSGKKELEKVKVVGNYTNDSNFNGGEYWLEIELDGKIVTANLDDLQSIKADTDTLRTLQVWQHRNM